MPDARLRYSLAVDPVAGLDAGAKLRDTYVIPPTVKNYIAILALDEMRGDFKPQDMSRIQVQNPTTANCAFLPFPGVHNTVVVQKNSGLPEMTRVVRALAYKFLSPSALPFNIPKSCLIINRCELYATMLVKRQQYAALFKKGFMNKQMGGVVERTVRTNVQSYVGADVKFFVNEHHRRCFELAWPQIYNYFFTSRAGAPGTGMVSKTIMASSPLAQEITQISQQDSASSGLLEAIYGVTRSGTGQLGTGRRSGKFRVLARAWREFLRPPNSAAAV